MKIIKFIWRGGWIEGIMKKIQHFNYTIPLPHSVIQPNTLKNYTSS